MADVLRSISGAAAIPVNFGGVLLGELNELFAAPAFGGIGPVTVSTGRALAYGQRHEADASVVVTVAIPASATRIDRIVLRKAWAAQTVRITRIAGVEGSGVPPALTQTAGVVWDTPLWRASITTGGAITMTDERQWVDGPRLILRDYTAFSLSNSNVETTIFTFVLPAGTLTFNRRLRVEIYGTATNTSGSGQVVIFRAKYGATTVATVTPSVANGAAGEMRLTFDLMAMQATAVQHGSLEVRAGSGGGGVAGIVAVSGGAAAENSGAGLAIAITVQMVANAAIATTAYYAQAEVL